MATVQNVNARTRVVRVEIGNCRFFLDFLSFQNMLYTRVHTTTTTTIITVQSPRRILIASIAFHLLRATCSIDIVHHSATMSSNHASESVCAGRAGGNGVGEVLESFREQPLWHARLRGWSRGGHGLGRGASGILIHRGLLERDRPIGRTSVRVRGVVYVPYHQR